MIVRRGFTAVELLITLFVASVFLGAGYTLFSFVIRDSGDVRAEVRATRVANDYLGQYSVLDNACEPASPLVDEPVAVEGLNSVRVSVDVSCPNPAASNLALVEVTVVYNSPEKTIALSGYGRGGAPTTEQSLAAWWPMSGNANDAVGSNNGTVSGASLTYDRFGEPNGAYSFDGVDDYIEVAPTIDDFSEFTVSAWAKVVGGPSAQTGHGYIVHRSDGATQSGSVYYLAALSTSPAYGGEANGFDGGGYTSVAANATDWKMVTMSYDGYRVTTYINGQEEASYIAGPMSSATSGTRVGIGSSPNDPTYRPAQGAIDDVRIYGRALVASEVSSLYSEGVGDSLLNGLAGWWPLDGNANDASGNGNNGAVSGAIATGGYDGLANSAYSFDGVDDIIQMPNSDLINLAASYSEKTISLWFHAHDTTGKQILYEQGGTSKGLNVYIDGGSLYVSGWSLNDEDSTTPWGHTYISTNVATGSWNHVVLTLDTGSSLIGYLNGQSFGSSTNVGNLFTHTGDVNLGGLGDSTVLHDGVYSDPAPFNGSIDDLKLWNRTLSAPEVADLYNSGSSSELFGLVGWWPLNGDADDATGSGLGGTVIGASLATGENGDPNGAYSFDGSSNSISIPNSPLLNTGTSYGAKTLSLWFYANDVSGRRVLYEEGGGSNGLNLYIDNGSIYMGVWSINNGWGPYYVDASVGSATWNNVTLVYDQGDGAVDGYLNGVSIGSVSGAGLLNAHSGRNSIGQAADNTLFHDGSTDLVDYYDGIIDDVRAYNRALSAPEAQALYEAGAS